MLKDQRNLPDGARRRLVDHFGADVLDERRRGFDTVYRSCIAEERVTRSRVEVRAADGAAPVIVGYATVYDAAYDVFGGPPYGWTEIIAKGAADKSVSEQDDVYLFFDHEGLPLAATKDRSLRLESDRIGLFNESTIDPRSQWSMEIVHRIESGVLDAMSFAFRVTRQRWEDEDGNETDAMTAPIRRILEVKLYDVAVVSFPANPATAVQMQSARSAITLAEAKQLSRPGLSLAEAQAQLGSLRA